MEKDEVINKIISQIDSINKITTEVKKLSPIKIASRVQWTGAIGVIQESRENKKLCKFLNETIVYNGKHFTELYEELIEHIKTCVACQLKLQQLISKEDKMYYGFISDIWNQASMCNDALANYCEEAATANIDDETYYDKVHAILCSEIKKLDLNSEQTLRTNKNFDQDIALICEALNENNTKSGCFGMLVLLIISSISIVEVGIWGFHQLII